MVKCAIYARVSTDEQTVGDYNSIDSQIDICKHYIQVQKERNWVFVKSYTDPGYSGKDLERPGIQELLQDIKAGSIEVVIVYKIERLVRCLYDFYKLWDVFEANGVAFASATQHFDTSVAMGKLTLNILLSFAQFERENTVEKTRDKMKQRAKLGKWHGGWIPFGYNYNTDTKKLVINGEEAPAIKAMFDSFDKGEKPSEIANKFNANGVRTKKRTVTTRAGQKKVIGENRLNEDFIKNILQNPIYKGYVQSCGEEFKGEHEAIIPINVWESVNKKLNTKIPSKSEYKKDDHIHLLKGLIKCGGCDSAMIPYPSGKKDKNGMPYLYYACGKVLDDGKESNCTVRMLPAREFENIIKKVLKNLGENKSLIESTIKNTFKLSKKRIQPLETEKEKKGLQLNKITVKIARLVKIMESEDMLGKEIADEYKTLLKEKEELTTQQEKIQIDIERCKQDNIDAEVIKEALLSFDKIISALPLEDQKELFQLLIKEIMVWSFDPEKEKAPQERGAFITKIRTKWFKIRLDLYQIPQLESYYKSLSEQMTSSDFTGNWLPR